ncbi:hypothetical protein VPH35_038407 [Triticum aestivum]
MSNQSLNSNSSCPHGIKQTKNPRKISLFLIKQKVGSLVYQKHKLIRPKKLFRLCIHDEFGTRALSKPAVILRATTLHHEIKLRTARRNILWIYRVHKVRTWTSYKENIEVINRLHHIFDHAIRRYTEHRLEAGLFYLVRDMDGFTHTVRSHLYSGTGSEFLRDLWRKKRLERKMRQTNKEVCNCSASAQISNLCDRKLSSIVTKTLKLCSMRHIFCLLLVIFLAFLIVYM